MTTATLSELHVTSPTTDETIQTIVLDSKKELETKIQNAKEAQVKWAATPIKERAQVFFRYKQLIEENIQELGELIHQENGKVIGEAIAEIQRGVEVIEYACSMPHLSAGERLEVSRGVECKSFKVPVGVVVSITPFNFPNMVPQWTIPNCLVLGNAMILKPSEQTPLSAQKMAELLTQAGLPENVFQVAIGAKESVELFCDHPDVDAITFVGSSSIAASVYRRASNNLKRALCLGGANNHILLLPDAHPEIAPANIAGSMCGCTGQRCMAASVLVAVGDCDALVDQVIEKVKAFVPGKDFGPIINHASRERIIDSISRAEAQGATIRLDGRTAQVPEKGSFLGATVIDNVTLGMDIATQEVFGPVISIIRVATLDEALKLDQGSLFGNGSAIFTQNGLAAQKAVNGLESGMIGVNIGVPVPRDPFGFGGWHDSKYGVGDITGKEAINFFTKTKKVTTKWNPQDQVNWMS